ncbi:hypothetical protein P4O66_002722 [Electrophorus voltai]|uniref:Rho-GAP domain-containing protein n=1 Tax=Electrophorus voltai TaxID=2609070 RepID=A0AAD9DMP5_9TELE|nr:hypothetical protein P4O66_002722 [Electrophorus voltai]
MVALACVSEVVRVEQRDDWLSCLWKVLDSRQEKKCGNGFFKTAVVSTEGYLEMTSPCNKLYTVVNNHKVYLFRNREEYLQGIGITDIDMSRASVKQTSKFVKITTPYRTFSKANQFWAVDVPACERLSQNASSSERVKHITAKYQDAMYCKRHTLYGQQKELNNALCTTVQTDNLVETLSLLFSGAEIRCYTGIPEFPSPLALAKHTGQPAQVELLRHHLTTALCDSVGDMVFSWRGGSLHVIAENKPHFPGWVRSIGLCGGAGDQPLSLQQLTESGIPIAVDRCLDHITRHGLMSTGIYRKCGVHSHVSALLEEFLHDARSVCVPEDIAVDNVANTLKRFLRENFSNINHMTTRNLGLVFGPTLFQTDKADPRTFKVVEDLIGSYCAIFNISDAELQKQMDMTLLILNKLKDQASLTPVPSHTVCAIYLEKREEDAELLVQSNISESYC